MKKIDITIPRGIRYISEIADFDPLHLIDSGHCIVDKVLPGCGFTHYALNCNGNVILCSPRKMLLQNKFEQDTEGNLYLVVNELYSTLMIDREHTKATNIASVAPFISGTDSIVKYKDSDYDEVYIREYDGINTYIHNQIFKGVHEKRACYYKIMVTYDSFHMVRDILRSMNILDSFTVVVDEFQTIFQDARFKASMENKFMSSLKSLDKVYFVSATPMLDKYLDMLPEFKDMRYFRFDWQKEDPGRIIKPDLKIRSLSGTSSISVIKDIVGRYKSGHFVSSVNPITGASVHSREAVFYLNSVNKILRAIQKCGLRPDEVNILCSDTPENRRTIAKDTKLKALGKFDIGRVPLRNEPRKMFTFCTRTVYLGADFYSDNARSFIFADSNYACLAVDISQDLPQILGRQRLYDNPWKNSATFYFTPIYSINAKTIEEFRAVLDSKINETKNRLDGFRETTTQATQKEYIEMCKRLETLDKFATNYVSVVYDEESGKYYPVENKLVRISELRAFEIQQIDYKDRFSVFSVVQNQFGLGTGLEQYNDLPSFEARLEFLCTGPYSSDPGEIDDILGTLPPEDIVKKAYLLLGKDQCIDLGYDKRSIQFKLEKRSFEYSMLDDLVYKEFKVGDVLSLSDLKTRLGKIYRSVKICPFTATATDISYFFEAKKTKRTVNGVKGVNVFILGAKLR